MKIAFYKFKHGNWLDYLTAVVTFSKYSHCELVFSDGACGTSSAMDGGVRLKKIDLDSGHWDVFDLQKLDVPEESIKYWFSIHDGENYDYIGAFTSIFNSNYEFALNKWFCSEVCGIFVCSKNNLNPGSLFRYLKKISKIKE